MKDIIIIAIILCIVGFAAFYVHKEKKSGKKCVGCPHSDSCSGGCCGMGESPTE